MNYGARKYLEELEQENGDGEPIHQQDNISLTIWVLSATPVLDS